MSDKNRQNSKHVACNLKGNEMAIAIMRLALTCIFFACVFHALFRIFLQSTISTESTPDAKGCEVQTRKTHHISESLLDFHFHWGHLALRHSKYS